MRFKGFSGLLEMLNAQLNSEETARQILNEIQSIFPIRAKNIENNNNTLENRTETLESGDTDQTAQTRTKKISKKLIDSCEFELPFAICRSVQ